MDDDDYIKRVLELAAGAISDGDGPFGACLVRGDRVLASSRNRTVAEDNPTAHAEMIAIREACRSWGSKALEGATAYCSCEPCAMCLMALFYVGVKRVVYAATLDDARAVGSGDPPLNAEALNELGHLDLQLVHGALRTEAREVFQRYLDAHGHL